MSHRRPDRVGFESPSGEAGRQAFRRRGSASGSEGLLEGLDRGGELPVRGTGLFGVARGSGGGLDRVVDGGGADVASPESGATLRFASSFHSPAVDPVPSQPVVIDQAFGSKVVDRLFDLFVRESRVRDSRGEFVGEMISPREEIDSAGDRR